MKNIFIIGGASYNSVISLEDFPKSVPQTIHSCEFDETIGNTGAGKALTLSKLGFHTTFHSLIGEDSYGEKVTSFLKEKKLHFITDIDPKGTERHLNIMNANGERISIFMNPSSATLEIKYSKFEKHLKIADYVIVNIANYCRHILPVCKMLNKEVWTDLHDYDGRNEYHQDFIEGSDYLFLSSDNLPEYKAFMKSQIEKGKKLVVCTHGKDGSTAYTNEGIWIETPIIDTYKMINTNGAGDAFFSGFLYGVAKEYDTKKCLQFGTIAAGLCIESKMITNNKLNQTLIENEYVKYFVK